MLRDALDPLLDRLETCEVTDRLSIIAEIKRQLEAPGEDGCYPLEFFLERLTLARRGQVYGYQTSYIAASLETDHPVNETVFRHWRVTKRVPAVYVDQIATMTFSRRSGIRRPCWVESEIAFLADAYTANPTAANTHLSHCCSVEFHRSITQNAIKGQLHRLMEDGRIVGVERRKSKHA